MQHLQEELSAYVSNELSESERIPVEAHLADCTDCMEQLRRLQSLDVLLTSQSDALEPSTDFVKRVLSGLGPERRFLTFHVRRSAVLMLAAAVIVFFAFLLTLQKDSPVQPQVVRKPAQIPSTSKPPEEKKIIQEPARVAEEDPELIAHLDALQDMELIQDLENLDSLDAAVLFEDGEETE